MPEQWILLIIVGFVAGILSGMFGIGGGVIIVPALTIFIGFDSKEAISTSLAALLLPVGIFAVIAYYRAGLMEVRAAALIALGLLLTSYLGAKLTIGLPEETLKTIYGVFLLYNSWRFIEPRKLYASYPPTKQTVEKVAQVNPDPAAPALRPQPLPPAPWYFIFMIGLIAGIASGMFGIGGGLVIVPALMGLLKYDQKQAVGTSLGALMLPVGLPGVLAYQQEGVLDLPIAGIVAVGLLLGAIFGAKIALNLPSKTIKQLYGVFLIFVALRFILG